MIEAFPTLNIYGKPAAGIGHKVVCPQCKGTFPIVQGATNYMFMGKNIALDGMQTACGATLIATQGQATVEVASGSSAGASTSNSQKVSSVAVTTNQAPPSQNFDLFFKLMSKTDGGPLVDWPYTLELPNGTTVKGRTDENGHTEKISDVQAVSARLSVYEPDVTPINPNWDR